MPTETRTIHLVSWNVAAWLTTLPHILRHYGTLEAWLDRHRIDVLCLQEVTSPFLSCERTHGADRPNPGQDHECQADARPQGTRGHHRRLGHVLVLQPHHGEGQGRVQWRRHTVPTVRLGRRPPLAWPPTRWCCRGLTSSADAAALGSDELDTEGRCMLTVHNGWALFNVYVPNSGAGSKRLPYKVGHGGPRRRWAHRLTGPRSSASFAL